MGPGRGRHVDRRRRLTPRAYFADPWSFGVARDATAVTPPGGDDVSRRIAELQHRLVLSWKQTQVPRARDLCALFGISKQTFSRVVLGERWAGETVLAALISAVAQRGAPDANPPST
jgi:hypothetical protein